MPAGPPPSTTTSWSWRTGILRSGSWMKSVIAGRASGLFLRPPPGRFRFEGVGDSRPAAEKVALRWPKPEHYTAGRGSEARIVTRPSEFLGRAGKNNRAQQ